jgi:hypothetical protein
MLSGKESIETLQAMIKEAIEQDDWFLVGRLQARLEKAKNLKK